MIFFSGGHSNTGFGRKLLNQILRSDFKFWVSSEISLRRQAFQSAEVDKCKKSPFFYFKYLDGEKSLNSQNLKNTKTNIENPPQKKNFAKFET